MLVLSYSVGDYKVVINKTNSGYSYKIKTKIQDKMYEVARSYFYFGDFDRCKAKADDELEIIMDIHKML
jgi:hypothetical protein